MAFAAASTVETEPQLFVFDEADTSSALYPTRETARTAGVDRYRVLLLLAAFAFEVYLSTIWVALVEPPMDADHAQESPHYRHGPPATPAVKAAASAALRPRRAATRR